MEFRFETTKSCKSQNFPLGVFIDELSKKYGNQSDKEKDCAINSEGLIHFCAWRDQMRLGYLTIINNNGSALCFFKPNYEFIRFYNLSKLLQAFKDHLLENCILEKLTSIKFAYCETGQAHTLIKRQFNKNVSFKEV